MAAHLSTLYPPIFLPNFSMYSSYNNYTVVWEKFTVGYFRVKIVRGKIFLSLRVSDKNFSTTKYFKVKLFVPLLKNLMHNYT